MVRWVAVSPCMLTVRNRLAKSMPRDLTARQLQVVELIAAGHSTREIAAELGMGTGGVKMHLSKIYERLDCHNRVQIARWWMERERRNGR